jgi:hypothetical protein
LSALANLASTAGRVGSTRDPLAVGKIPQHRVEQRPVHTGLIHGGDRSRRGVRLLTMRQGRRTLFPEMDLGIDDRHLAYPFAGILIG